MENMNVNHLAVVVCALLNLVVGAIWYSPAMFFKPWKETNGFTDEDLKKSSPARTFGITLILSLIISYNLAFFLSDAATDWKWGLTAGFLAGFGWSAAIFTIVALFEMRSWKYILINSGYIIIYFSLIGLILGAWR